MVQSARVQGREGSDYSDPAGSMFRSYPIKLNDTADLSCPTRVLFIATAGVLHYKMVSGDERTRALPAGYHPLRISRIYASGTTIAEGDLEGHI